MNKNFKAKNQLDLLYYQLEKNAIFIFRQDYLGTIELLFCIIYDQQMLINHDFNIFEFQLMTNIYTVLILTVSSITLVNTQQDQHVQELTNSQTWGFGFLAGVGLSLIGFVAALIVVGLKKVVSQHTFKVITNLLYALGCGAMIGDAMIHILPQAYKSQQTNFRFVALIFISAIAVFIGIQRLFHKCGITHQHWGDQHSHQEGQSQHQNQHKLGNPKAAQLSPQKGIKGTNQNLQVNLITNNIPAGSFKELSKIPSSNRVSDSHKNSLQPAIKNSEEDAKENNQGCLSQFKGKGSAGYLNLLSSLIHNFIDGFAIGGAFATRERSQYVSTIVAVFAHEIPREMGDVGVLLKNNFNNCQTICCNGAINFVSLFGVLLGLGLGSISEATEIYIMTFVAGNFVYIGADIWRNLLKNKTAVGNFLEFLSFCIGVGSMYLVLLAQSSSSHQH